VKSRSPEQTVTLKYVSSVFETDSKRAFLRKNPSTMRVVSSLIEGMRAASTSSSAEQSVAQ
jgi:hypothetical protein